MSAAAQVPYGEYLERIEEAFQAAAGAVAPFRPGAIASVAKTDLSPVTEADRVLDHVLRKTLLRDGEGWLSEETADNSDRLDCEWVWVVDPIDGTLEFIQGIPEWCVSVGLVHRGRAVAGGIFNPQSGETILGAAGSGVTYNGAPASPSSRASLAGAVVLASRSEVKRGEWERFQGRSFEVRPSGSIAYKLAMVATGHVDAVWTLSPKNEWDVAAGSALVAAAGGFVLTLDFAPPEFNRKSCLMRGLVAGGPGLQNEIRALLDPYVT